MRRFKRHDLLIHIVLIAVLGLTLLPFVFVLNNSLRTNSEMNHAFFGVPEAAKQAVEFTGHRIRGEEEKIVMRVEAQSAEEALRGRALGEEQLAYSTALGRIWQILTQGYRYAWEVLRGYTLNTIFVSVAVMLGVVFIGTMTAYVFSRYRFPGHRLLFFAILSFMMVPGVLTLVPSFLLVKSLGLLNSYWVLILPYVAGGQVLAIFLFKTFFDGLPSELFEAARMDGAGHFRIYWNIVLPLSKPIIAVVMIISVLGTWNNFLWPFITNSDPKYHVVSSGLFLMGQSEVAANQATMFAAYMLSSVPLLILFLYATKPFMQGVTSGAFKA